MTIITTVKFWHNTLRYNRYLITYILLFRCWPSVS